MLFTKAIVRKPGVSFANGLTTSKNMGSPSLAMAQAQHQNYISQLEKSGLIVERLDSLDKLPDSTFVEDVALIAKPCAVITSPGAPSRVPEVGQVEGLLEERFECLERILLPGILEGGDILQIGKHFFIGISSRTNREGARQLTSILKKYGYTTSPIELSKFFHLKTGVSFLGENTILVADELTKHHEFEKFEKIVVPPEEVYCANSLRINDCFLMPSGFPQTQEKVASLCQHLGLDLKILELSEFQKMDGGASCLSLRF